MKYRKLGRSDLRVSEICLGTMTWGARNSEAEGFAQMDYALDHGVNFFDTAELYPAPPAPATQGATEEIIGNWFAGTGKRDRVVLASKVTGNGISWTRDGADITGEEIRKALEGNLRRLKTDHIELYQLHWPNRGSFQFRRWPQFDPTKQPREATLENFREVLETLDDLIREGKIGQIGISNESCWGTAQYLRIADQAGLPRIVTIQNEYNLLCRLYDLDLAELSHQEDVGLLAFSPLAAGLLSGKYRGDVTPPGTRRSINATLGGRINAQSMQAVGEYVDLARRHGLDEAAFDAALEGL
ncbi:MAG: aldo/keto reductase, partial [Paracoccaceae bacterium]